MSKINVHKAPYLEQLLLEAAAEGNLDLVRTVLSDGSTIHDLVNSTNEESGCTALHLAAQRGNFDIASLLLQNQADIGIADKFNKTPLHYACEGGFLQIVDTLLRSVKRIDMNEIYYLNKAKMTLLQTAAVYKHVDIVKLLISFGSSPNEVNMYGETALHLVAKANNSEMAELLIGYGASLDERTIDSGDTPLHYACYENSTEVADILVKTGACIHATNLCRAKKSSLEIARDLGHSHLANLITKISRQERNAFLRDSKRKQR